MDPTTETHATGGTESGAGYRTGWLAEERAVEAYREAGAREGPVWEPIGDDYDLGDIVVELRHAQRMKAAWTWVERQLRMEVGERLGKGGAFRLGDTWYRYNRGWTEKCIDRSGFWEWVEAYGDPETLFNPDYAYKTGMPQEVRDTFFEKVDGPYDVTVMNIIGNPRMPKYLATLPDGTLLRGKPDKPVEDTNDLPD